MRLYPLIIFFCLAFTCLFSCNKESFEQTKEIFLLRDLVTTMDRKEESITVNVKEFSGIIDYIGTPDEPDFYKIYFYENPNQPILFENFSSKDNFPLTFENLKKGVSYYSQLVVGKDGVDSIEYPLMMTMTGSTPEVNLLFPEINPEFRAFTYSFDQTYLAFISNKNRRKHFYQKIDKDIPTLFAETHFGASWSPTKHELVYLSDIIIENHLHAYQVILFDVEENLKYPLFTIDNEQYDLLTIRYTSDGESLIFLSSEGNDNSRHYDFWTYDLSTLEKRRHSDLNGFQFYNLAPQFTPTNTLYLSGKFPDSEDDYNIYSYDYVQNQLTPIIESEWSDTHPAVSPDGQKIAFFSNRSGWTDIWTYDLKEETFIQVTDSDFPGIGGPGTKLEWREERTLVTSVYFTKDQVYRPVRIKL